MFDVIALVIFVIIIVIGGVVAGTKSKQCDIPKTQSIAEVKPHAPKPRKKRTSTQRRVQFSPEVQWRTVREDLPVAATSTSEGIISEDIVRLAEV